MKNKQLKQNPSENRLIFFSSEGIKRGFSVENGDSPKETINKEDTVDPIVERKEQLARVNEAYERGKRFMRVSHTDKLTTTFTSSDSFAEPLEGGIAGARIRRWINGGLANFEVREAEGKVEEVLVRGDFWKNCDKWAKVAQENNIPLNDPSGRTKMHEVAEMYNGKKIEKFTLYRIAEEMEEAYKIEFTDIFEENDELEKKKINNTNAEISVYKMLIGKDIFVSNVQNINFELISALTEHDAGEKYGFFVNEIGELVQKGIGWTFPWKYGDRVVMSDFADALKDRPTDIIRMLYIHRIKHSKNSGNYNHYIKHDKNKTFWERQSEETKRFLGNREIISSEEPLANMLDSDTGKISLGLPDKNGVYTLCGERHLGMIMQLRVSKSGWEYTWEGVWQGKSPGWRILDDKAEDIAGGVDSHRGKRLIAILRGKSIDTGGYEPRVIEYVNRFRMN